MHKNEDVQGYHPPTTPLHIRVTKASAIDRNDVQEIGARITASERIAMRSNLQKQ